MHFVTAIVGSDYIRVGRGLIRSIAAHAPQASVLVVTDRGPELNDLETANIQILEQPDIRLDRFSTERDDGIQGRWIGKFGLLRQVQEQFPGEDVTWIDADMLVFDQIDDHLVPGAVNVVAHGRRDGELIDIGGGLSVPGSHYAVSALFSLPPGPALDILEAAATEKLNLKQSLDNFESKYADQLLLNHLVHDSELTIHWVTDNRSAIYNLELSERRHPQVGDRSLRRIAWGDYGPEVDGRRIVVWCWTKKSFERHARQRFRSFARTTAKQLRVLYSD